MADMNDQVGAERRHDEWMRSPSFCKTVTESCLEGGPSCWMQVPPEFMRNHLPHVEWMSMLLLNAAGETWPVLLVAKHGFGTGWAEFATGNALAIGDTLVFWFVEETMYFVVQVFGMSGCEKRTQHRDLARRPVRPEHDPELRPGLSSDGADRPLPNWDGGHSQPDLRAEICQRSPSTSQADLTEVVKAMGKRGDPASTSSRPLGNDGKIGRGGSSSVDSHRRDDADAAADLSELRMSTRRCMYPRGPPQGSFTDAGAVVTKKSKGGRRSKHVAPGSSTSRYSSRDFKFVSRRREVTKVERQAALLKAKLLASVLDEDSSVCVMVMRPSYVYQKFALYVPRQFANLYMPDNNRDVCMVDNAWNMWVGRWNASNKYISDDWRDFALCHCLEEGDAVVLEILDLQDPDVLTLKVHLFPVVPVQEGITGWHSHLCPPNSSLCDDDIPTGCPIDPLPRLRGKITPRPQRPRKRRVARKRVHSDSEDSFTTSDSSNELD